VLTSAHACSSDRGPTIIRDAQQCNDEACTHLQTETFPAEEAGGTPRFYTDLSFEERTKLLRDRLKKYCQKARTVASPHNHCLNPEP
jgi:hypothetical protein